MSFAITIHHNPEQRNTFLKNLYTAPKRWLFRLMPDTTPPTPAEGQLATNTAPIVPGQKTTEFGSLIGLAGVLPFLKDQPPVVIICLTGAVCFYMGTRAWLKGRA